MHPWGQQAILARRLVERGRTLGDGWSWKTPMASVHPLAESGRLQLGQPRGQLPHFRRMLRWRFPLYDQVITAMIEDLYARGLNKRVLLVVTGEFGRTPRITHQAGSKDEVSQPGRDHCAQGDEHVGFRRGYAHRPDHPGATNKKGNTQWNAP